MEQNNSEKFEVRDLREKEWFVVDDKFLNGYARFIGVYAVGVYSSLCRHANKKQKTWPSVKSIGQELSISRSKAIESIKCLEFWKIIKKIRVGKHCNNRYFLLKKSCWKPINEQTLKEFSEVCHINFSSLLNRLQKYTPKTSISKETQSKNIQRKEAFSLEEKREISENYKKGNKSFKPFYINDEMRWKKAEQKWYVIQKGEWLEYGDKEANIEWRPNG